MATSYSPSIVTDGLVLALDAANSLSYPGTGTTLYDLSGNNYNFTLQGNAAYSAEGKGSIYLDGSADGIQLTGNGHITRSTQLIKSLLDNGFDVDVITSGNNSQLNIPFK